MKKTRKPVSKSHEVSMEAFMLLMSLARLSTVGASCAKGCVCPKHGKDERGDG
jgi:hypothetical protein